MPRASNKITMIEGCPIPPVRVDPNREQCNHTRTPSGYIGWHAWADIAAKTHRQVRCPKCGLWAIWLPKAEAKAVNQKHERELKSFVSAQKKGPSCQK